METTYPSNFIEIEVPSQDRHFVRMLCEASIGSAIYVRNDDKSVAAVMGDFIENKQGVLVKLDILDEELQELINLDCEIWKIFTFVNPIDCYFEKDF